MIPAAAAFSATDCARWGARAEACTNGLSALERARVESFDLLLLDCRMPGAGALQILTTLREDSDARSADSIAVATTADLAPGDRMPLLAAGFSEILLKPCGLSDLQRVLTLSDRSGIAVLDDSAALMTTGDATTMRALRLLLREELALLERELDQLSLDHLDFGRAPASTALVLRILRRGHAFDADGVAAKTAGESGWRYGAAGAIPACAGGDDTGAGSLIGKLYSWSGGLFSALDQSLAGLRLRRSSERRPSMAAPSRLRCYAQEEWLVADCRPACRRCDQRRELAMARTRQARSSPPPR